MKKHLSFFSILLLMLMSVGTVSAQNITVKPVNPATNPLVDSLVKTLVGSGVTIGNIRTNLTQNSPAYGSFKDATGTMGVPAGLALTTGKLTDIIGSGTNAQTDNNAGDNDANGTIGIGLLRNILGNNVTTQDGCVIQFEVTPSSDTISFNYMFASEEYNSFVGSGFNDAFGLFIQGPGIPTQVGSGLPPNTRNIAELPTTNTANKYVSINNVNGGNDDNNTNPSNVQYYINNVASGPADQPLANLPALPLRVQKFKYDGLTTKLTAKIKVIPCQTYTLVFAITDVQDGIYDSGVFIEKGSLKSFGASVAAASFFPRFQTGIEGCNQGKLTFKRPPSSVGQEIIARYVISGSAKNDELVNTGDYNVSIDGAPYAKLPDSIIIAPSQDSVQILINVFADGIPDDNETLVLKLKEYCPPFNLRPDSIVLPIREKYVYRITPDEAKVCIGTPSQLNNLNVDTTFKEYYRWRELGANGDTIIPTTLSCLDCRSPLANPSVNTKYVIFAQDSISGCPASDTVQVKVYTFPRLRLAPEICGIEPLLQYPQYNNAYAICFGEQLCIKPNAVTSNGTLSYLWTIDLAKNTLVGGALTTDSILKVNPLESSWFKVIVTNELGCATTDSIYVTVVMPPVFSFTPSKTTICFGDEVNLFPKITASTLDGFETYTWTANRPNPNIANATNDSTTARPKTSMVYTLTINKGPCEVKRNFTVDVADSLETAFTYSVAVVGDTIAPTSVSFVGDVAPINAEYVWNINSTTLDPRVDTVVQGTLTPSYTFREPDIYRVKLSALTRKGNLVCYDSTVQYIRILPEDPFPVNVITPEPKDGKNDVLQFANKTASKSLISGGILKVYNRWGKEVYSSDDYQNDWSAEGFPAGTYYYHYTSPKRKITVKSWLEILR
jgi:hypothetical protein